MGKETQAPRRAANPLPRRARARPRERFVSDHASVYVTCPDEATARRIARELLERRLVACANLLPVTSLYRWRGAIEEAPEVAMFLKTTRGRVDEVVKAVAGLHPYEVPCAVAFELGAGHAPYYAWVDEETRDVTGAGARGGPDA